MPRATKKDKFFLTNPKKSGFLKRKFLVGINIFYEGQKESITLQDLNEFLTAHGFDLSSIPVRDDLIMVIPAGAMKKS